MFPEHQGSTSTIVCKQDMHKLIANIRKTFKIVQKPCFHGAIYNYISMNLNSWNPETRHVGDFSVVPAQSTLLLLSN